MIHENIKAAIFDASGISRTIKRISHEILEKNDDFSSLCLVGIRTRGVPMAHRIAECIKNIEGIEIPTGNLDITFYRDDLSCKDANPTVNCGEIGFCIEGKNVILVDDVIFTGRTVRAALDAIMANGRAARIQLAVLVDRGHREIPIRPDYVGKNIPTSKNEIVRVSFTETDGVDKVDLFDIPSNA